MKSYKVLREISEGLYLNLINDKDVIDRLVSKIETIHSSISLDFKTIFNRDLQLKDYQVYFDDETYRQSATGVVLREEIKDSDMEVRFECLIDHDRIWVKVSNATNRNDLKELIATIESSYGVEGSSELKDIWDKKQ